MKDRCGQLRGKTVFSGISLFFLENQRIPDIFFFHPVISHFIIFIRTGDNIKNLKNIYKNEDGIRNSNKNLKSEMKSYK